VNCLEVNPTFLVGVRKEFFVHTSSIRWKFVTPVQIQASAAEAFAGLRLSQSMDAFQILMPV
jgi:hypothetical protein